MKSIFIFILLFFLYGCTSSDIELETSDNKESIELLTVYITGEVNFEGVYMIESNKLLIDLVNKAGGFTKDANISNINLARHLTANEMIIIPRMENSSNNNLININTGSLEELDSLPGIGKTYAEKIIEYRKEYGFFNTIEDIKKVPGIKDDIFEKIKNLITV